jgi:hypothetical protein
MDFASLSFLLTSILLRFSLAIDGLAMVKLLVAYALILAMVFEWGSCI